MTNPDNVGGLALCPFCGDYGAEVAESAVPMRGGGQKRAVYCNGCFCEGPTAETDDAAIAAWNRRAILMKSAEENKVSELCRAATAGGDVEVVRLRQLLAGTQEQFRVVSELLERNQAHHERMMKLMDSAPAGSGEVADEVMKIADFFEGVRVFVTSREKIKHPEGTDLFDGHVTRLLRVAALLRKLQQGADEGRSRAYDQVDRFLRNNLGDEAYAKYSDALEVACGYAASQGQEGGNG